MTRWYVLLVLVWGLSACTLTTTPNESLPTPVQIAITQGINTCDDVLAAAFEQLPCPIDGNGICFAAATYATDNPAENVVSVGYLNTDAGTLGSIAPLERSQSRWQAYHVRGRVDGVGLSLVVLDGLQLTLDDFTVDTLSATLDTDTTPTCDGAPMPALLLQADDEQQATLTLNGVTISAKTSAAIWHEGDALIISALDGVTVVSSQGVTRIVRPDQQTRITLTNNQADATPIPAIAADSERLANLPLSVLPRLITLTERDTPAANTTSRTTQPRATAPPCVPNANWTGEHTIARGESLVRIAPLYNITVEELQDGNCIPIANRIRAGEVLRVPTEADLRATATPIITTTPPTDSNDPRFTVDATAPITAGACTYLRWSVDTEGVTVFLDGQPVSNRNGREVCPDLTTVYTLEIQSNGAVIESLTAVVTVQP